MSFFVCFVAKDSTCVWLPWPYHFARGLRQSCVSDLESVHRATCRPCPRVDFQGQQFDQLLLPWPRFRIKTWCFLRHEEWGNCRNPCVSSCMCLYVFFLFWKSEVSVVTWAMPWWIVPCRARAASRKRNSEGSGDPDLPDLVRSRGAPGV